MFGREPVVFMALLRAAIVLGVSFGLKLTEEQTLAIYGLAEAVLAFVTRQKVTPMPKSGGGPGKMAAVSLVLFLTACSPTQLQDAAKYASQAAAILDAGSKVAEAAARAKQAGLDAKKAAIRSAATEAGTLTIDAARHLGEGTPEGRMKAREALLQAISLLQPIRGALPDSEQRMLKEAEAILVGMIAEDLKRVYSLGDRPVE